MCDDEGIDSLWQTDRLVSREPFLECMSTMAAPAGATKKIKFGMNVASLGIRDPLITAKECATIDYLIERTLAACLWPGKQSLARLDRYRKGDQGAWTTDERGLEDHDQSRKDGEVTFHGKHFQYTDAGHLATPCTKPSAMLDWREREGCH